MENLVSFASYFAVFLLLPLSYFAFVLFWKIRNAISLTIFVGLLVATGGQISSFLYGFLVRDKGSAIGDKEVPLHVIVEKGVIDLGLLIAAIGFAGLALSDMGRGRR